MCVCVCVYVCVREGGREINSPSQVTKHRLDLSIIATPLLNYTNNSDITTKPDLWMSRHCVTIDQNS